MSNIDQLEFATSFSGLSGSSKASHVAEWWKIIYPQGNYATPESLADRTKSSLEYVSRQKQADHPLYKYAGLLAKGWNTARAAIVSDIKANWTYITGKSGSAPLPNGGNVQATSAPNMNSAPVSSTSSTTSVPAVPTSTGVSTTSEVEGFKKYLTTKNMIIGGVATAAILYFVLK
ncbi:hypothetical protein OKW21_000600 [Catalinimonas alkaloidigena]|uniref:hypothetical protein n=1 Tax=Catalinimonas alkaloidigena TaxID=1075417 RepID=UPI00240627DF|nr:hypothetical protein [Catalinimonas alkaloidigena]MDF9795337.1 hypothetical protein [Catalinimonas alkaloidigena]